MVHVRPCNRVPVRVFAVVNVCLCVRAPVWGLQVTARDSRRTAQRSTSQRTTRRFCCRYRMTLTRTVPQCNAHLTGERALTQCVRKTRVVCARGPCLLRLATRAMGSKRARTRAHAHLRPACGGTRCSVTIVEGHVCNFAIIEWPIPWCVDTPFSASCPSSLHPNRKRYMPSPRPQGPNRTPQTAHPKPYNPALKPYMIATRALCVTHAACCPRRLLGARHRRQRLRTTRGGKERTATTPHIAHLPARHVHPDDVTSPLGSRAPRVLYAHEPLSSVSPCPSKP